MSLEKIKTRRDTEWEALFNIINSVSARPISDRIQNIVKEEFDLKFKEKNRKAS